mgnify:CR=1 FL=1
MDADDETAVERVLNRSGGLVFIEDATGKLVKMRADDGVHFERAAGDLIADEVLERLSERYDFTSWRGGELTKEAER